MKTRVPAISTGGRAGICEALAAFIVQLYPFPEALKRVHRFKMKDNHISS